MLWVPRWCLTPFSTMAGNNSRLLSCLLKIYIKKVHSLYYKRNSYNENYVNNIIHNKHFFNVINSSIIAPQLGSAHHSAWEAKAGRSFTRETTLGNEVF